MSEVKLKQVFCFLNEHKEYNQKFQIENLKRKFKSVDDIKTRARLLLHDTFNSQSQPKIDEYHKFIEPFRKDQIALKSFKSFKNHLCKELNIDSKMISEIDLFQLLKAQPGWGDKTAALFVKNLFLISKDDFLKKLFWDDISDIQNDDELIKLPVDAVIKKIFNLNVKEINIKIELYNNTYNLKKHEIVLWDDLWFWGFITQKSLRNGERTFEWNESKFLSLFDAFEMNIKEIKKLANDFIKIIKK
jgi:hypothetical protein